MLTPMQEALLLELRAKPKLDPADNARAAAVRVLDALGYVLVLEDRRERARNGSRPGKIVLLTNRGSAALDLLAHRGSIAKSDAQLDG